MLGTDEEKHKIPLQQVTGDVALLSTKSTLFSCMWCNFLNHFILNHKNYINGCDI